MLKICFVFVFPPLGLELLLFLPRGLKPVLGSWGSLGTPPMDHPSFRDCLKIKRPPCGSIKVHPGCKFHWIPFTQVERASLPKQSSPTPFHGCWEASLPSCSPKTPRRLFISWCLPVICPVHGKDYGMHFCRSGEQSAAIR